MNGCLLETLYLGKVTIKKNDIVSRYQDDFSLINKDTIHKSIKQV